MKIGKFHRSRSVLLHTKPRVFVQDITVKTSITGTTGIIKYSVQAAGLREGEIADCTVVLRDDRGTIAVDEFTDGLSGTIKVHEAKFWWPRGMHPEPAYLYTLEVFICFYRVEILNNLFIINI